MIRLDAFIRRILLRACFLYERKNKAEKHDAAIQPGKEEICQTLGWQ
jgi:hypothetical protein